MSAAVLAVTAAFLLWPVPTVLAGSSTALRHPALALLAWQCVGLASGLSAVAAGLLYGLPTPWAERSAPQHVATFSAMALAGYLLAVAAYVAARTVVRRHRHRVLLDLVSTPIPDLPGGCVLASTTAMAYCVPGLRRPRMVLTSAALSHLSPDAIAAVIAHEQAHLDQRHDLVVLPFIAWQTALPFLPGARTARAAVALLIESLADDAASARVGAAPLDAALRTITMAPEIPGTPPAEITSIHVRLARLNTPHETLDPLR